MNLLLPESNYLVILHVFPFVVILFCYNILQSYNTHSFYSMSPLPHSCTSTCTLNLPLTVEGLRKVPSSCLGEVD